MGAEEGFDLGGVIGVEVVVGVAARAIAEADSTEVVGQTKRYITVASSDHWSRVTQGSDSDVGLFQSLTPGSIEGRVAYHFPTRACCGGCGVPSAAAAVAAIACGSTSTATSSEQGLAGGSLSGNRTSRRGWL